MIKSNPFYSVWLPLIPIYNLHNSLLLGFLTLSNINKYFHIFQRNFYRSRDHSNNSMGSGSVLSTEKHEDQDRLRKKLENLELELKAAELVTRLPVCPLGNLNDISNDDVINHNIAIQPSVPSVPTVKKRSSHKREAPQPQGLSEKKRLEDEQEDNCIMCLQERAEISEKNDSKLSTCSEQRYSANKKMVIDSKLQRSKSDARDKSLEEDLSISIQGLKSKNSTISSKLIKRSKSFNRIFSYSMLNRSKEYRL